MKTTRLITAALLLWSALAFVAIAQQSSPVSSAWQKGVDEAMTKAANDPQALPETRASIAASQVEFDSLFGYTQVNPAAIARFLSCLVLMS